MLLKGRQCAFISSEFPPPGLGPHLEQLLVHLLSLDPRSVLIRGPGCSIHHPILPVDGVRTSVLLSPWWRRQSQEAWSQVIALPHTHCVA